MNFPCLSLSLSHLHFCYCTLSVEFHFVLFCPMFSFISSFLFPFPYLMLSCLVPSIRAHLFYFSSLSLPSLHTVTLPFCLPLSPSFSSTFILPLPSPLTLLFGPLLHFSPLSSSPLLSSPPSASVHL